MAKIKDLTDMVFGKLEVLKREPNELQHAGAMFPMLLNKGVDKYIMRFIRPSNNKVVVL